MSRSLRDQFVSGVADVETLRKLLEVERDFDACIKISLSVEVVSKESVSFKSSSAGVNFVKHNKHNKKPDSAVKSKGKRQNKHSNVCIYCHKTNHTEKDLLQTYSGREIQKVINLLVITCVGNCCTLISECEYI